MADVVQAATGRAVSRAEVRLGKQRASMATITPQTSSVGDAASLSEGWRPHPEATSSAYDIMINFVGTSAEEALLSASATAGSGTSLFDRAPLAGGARMHWLRGRLLDTLRQHTRVCPAAVGSTTIELLAMFEILVGERYAVLTSAPVAVRVRSLGRVLGYLASSAGEKAGLDPPLHSAVRSVGGRGAFQVWSRAPVVQVDGGAWRKTQEANEESRLQPTAAANGLLLEVEGRPAKRQRRGERGTQPPRVRLRAHTVGIADNEDNRPKRQRQATQTEDVAVGAAPRTATAAQRGPEPVARQGCGRAAPTAPT